MTKDLYLDRQLSLGQFETYQEIWNQIQSAQNWIQNKQFLGGVRHDDSLEAVKQCVEIFPLILPVEVFENEGTVHLSIQLPDTEVQNLSISQEKNLLKISNGIQSALIPIRKKFLRIEEADTVFHSGNLLEIVIPDLE